MRTRQPLLQRCLRDLVVQRPALVLAPETLSFLGIARGDLPPEFVRRADRISCAPIDHKAGTTKGKHSHQRMLLTRPPEADLTETEVADSQRSACYNCGGPLTPVLFGERLQRSGSLWTRLASAATAAKQIEPFGRRCRYDGHLYCHDCHSRHTAVIPWNILEAWDFREYEVCDDAAQFLSETRAQPLLVIDAASQDLFALSALLGKSHATRVRAQNLLEVVRGSHGEARTRLEVALRRISQRRYLLETADRWSVKDLVDLARGAAFAALPEWLQRQERWLQGLAASSVLEGSHGKG
jgi:hypothetical protein